MRIGTRRTISDLRLFDSNILIDYLRDDPEAVDCVESAPSMLSISIIVEAELYAGVHDENERRRIEIMLGEFQVFPVTRPIAVLGACSSAIINRLTEQALLMRSSLRPRRCTRCGSSPSMRSTFRCWTILSSRIEFDLLLTGTPSVETDARPAPCERLHVAGRR